MVISVDGLTIRYKDFTAVDGISFAVKEGEIFGIIGPNGAGKTSTIECLEGLRQPAKGRINVLGIDPVRQRRILYHKIGVQLQEASFPGEAKVSELCELFTSFYDHPMPYKELLERFDLLNKAKVTLKKLSGGQRQKVSIILALIANPEILFLDELTTGLDPQARVMMWDLIRELREEGKTIFMTTHFMEEAEALCNRVCIMVKGKIAALGGIRELIDQADISQKITFNAREITPGGGVQSDGLKTGLLSLPGVNKVEQNRQIEVYGRGKNLLRDVVVYLAESQVEFDELTCEKPGLEDVFFKLTGFRMEDGE